MERRNQYVSSLAALILVAVSYPLARSPRLSPEEASALATRFRFEKHPLPELPERPAYKLVRQVHPSLGRISAWVSSLGAAVTVADLDHDGLANDVIHVDPRTDLVTVAALMDPRRYQPFALDRSFWSHNGYDSSTVAPMGTVAGDFNEDGQTDILVYFWGRTPLIYLRKSPTTSTNGSLASSAWVPLELVDTGERWYSNCATQADVDGDGHVDLILGNYFQDGAKVLHAGDTTGTVVMHEGKSKAANGGKDRIFLWQSATTGPQPQAHFKEIPGAIPDEMAGQWALALGAADLDGDLLPEIYIANDFGPDHLLHNRSSPGKLRFVELKGKRGLLTPKSCVVGEDSFKGMGVDFGDINGDGHLDIFVSNIAAKFALTESHFVWLSTGEVDAMKQGIAPYTHGSEKLGLARSGFGWDVRLADFDNDGVLEAVQACGFIKGKINRWPELQALGTSNDQIVHNPRFWPNFRPGADLSGDDWNPFFARSAGGRYFDIAPQLGLREAMVSRGIATADLDGDGRLDFVCANQWRSSYYFHNQAPNPGAYLGLRILRGQGSPAVGAIATVKLADGRKLVSHVDGGTGHSGRRSSELHFGLGPAKTSSPVDVEIKWRDQTGAVKQNVLQLTSGRHTIHLDQPASAQKISTAPNRNASVGL